MLPEFHPVTLRDVLEFDGLIRVESGAVHTTPRFRRSMADATTRERTRHPDLRASITEAMHARYGKYLSESETQSLVDAMFTIASRER